MGAEPLRFVVLCDSPVFESWQAASLRDAIESGEAVPVGMVFRTAPAAAPSGGRWMKRWKDRRLLLWRMFNRFYVDKVSRATVQVDLSELFAGVPTVTDIAVKMPRGGEGLSDDALKFVTDLKPDFIIRFSYGILRGPVLDAARYGLWSYHHGDPAKFRGQPPGFWELATGSDVVGAMLQVLSDELDAGRVLHQGWFATTRQSYAKTRDTLYFGTSPWLRRTCADVRRNGWQSAASHKDLAEKGPIYKQPRNGTMVRFLATTARAFLAAQIRYRLYRQNWHIGVVPAPIDVVSGLAGRDAQDAALAATHWMKSPANTFCADPFGELAAEKTVRVFFELFDWKRGYGTIATTDFDGQGFSPPRDTLDTGTHLSYPFIFADGGDSVMIPEHSEIADVSGYLLDEHGQVKGRETLISGEKLIDSTIVTHGGKYWLFASLDGETKNTELHLYHADELTGPWQPHPLNPVKSDVTSSRPGGTPFVHEGKLYRPAQDCAAFYGSAVTLNEIVVLDENRFEERPVTRVESLDDSPYRFGLHTLSQVGPYTLIDGAENQRRFP